MTRSQHMIRRASVLIALLSILTVGVQPASVDRVVAASHSVSFEVSDPAIGFSATISSSVDWTDVQEVKNGNVAIIAYDLASELGTASVAIPLSTLDLGFVDQTVTVPLPEVPLGSVSIPLAQYLVGIPSSMASVDLVLYSSIRMLQVTSTSASLDMLTDINSLVWTSWGSKEVQILTSERVTATIRATLECTISVGMDVTFFGESVTLIPSTPIAGVSGAPELVTSLSVNDDSSLLVYAVGGTAAACVVAVVAFIAFRRRSMKGKTGQTSDGQSR